MLGDAGILVQPFDEGVGVFKATNDALELAKALNDADDVDEALETLERKGDGTGSTSALGRRKARATTDLACSRSRRHGYGSAPALAR